MFSGAKSWEEKQPIAAEALREIAEAHAQQDPSFTTSMLWYVSLIVAIPQEKAIAL